MSDELDRKHKRMVLLLSMHTLEAADSRSLVAPEAIALSMN